MAWPEDYSLSIQEAIPAFQAVIYRWVKGRTGDKRKKQINFLLRCNANAFFNFLYLEDEETHDKKSQTGTVYHGTGQEGHRNQKDTKRLHLHGQNLFILLPLTKDTEASHATRLQSSFTP